MVLQYKGFSLTSFRDKPLQFVKIRFSFDFKENFIYFKENFTQFSKEHYQFLRKFQIIFKKIHSIFKRILRNFLENFM